MLQVTVWPRVTVSNFFPTRKACRKSSNIVLELPINNIRRLETAATLLNFNTMIGLGSTLKLVVMHITTAVVFGNTYQEGFQGQRCTLFTRVSPFSAIPAAENDLQIFWCQFKSFVRERMKKRKLNREMKLENLREKMIGGFILVADIEPARTTPSVWSRRSGWFSVDVLPVLLHNNSRESNFILFCSR